MYEIEEKKTWTEILPSLFNLLVENADGIIDDTSLQRILEWLKNVCKNEQELQKLLQCGTVEFMSKDHVFSNPESSTFFLRLFGCLVARAEIFNSFKSDGDGDFVARFLDKPRNNPILWNEGIVRNGYFQALISLTEHKDGVLWLRSTDHIECALDCISDRSMYVANSARSLITKFLIKETEWMVNQTPKTEHNLIDNDKVAIIVGSLRSMLNPEASTPTTSMLAVIEVTRMLLCESSVSGQKILQDTKLFPECLNLMKVGDSTVCQKLVDVICKTAKKSRGSLEWRKLTAAENIPQTTASEVLLGSCMDLFKKGLISTGLELVSGLGSCQETSRDFPLHWLDVLFDITELTLDVILNQSCDNNEESQNDCHVNGHRDLDTRLDKGLLSHGEQRKTFSKQNLQCILSPWIKESHSLTQVICQAIAAAQQLTQQASSQHHSHVLYWLKLCVDLLQYCINPIKQSTVKLHGNQKVLKACLEFIASFAEVRGSKDIFEDTEYSTVNQLFDDLVGTLLQLIESSESTATVISTSLKTLGKVLDAARPAFLTELFNSEIKTTDERCKKRAKLENSPPCEDVQQSSTLKVENREKLAFMLYRRLRDSRWEVRDSTLEFVASLLQLPNQDSVQEFLCFHNIPVLVWKAVDDSESYVRASAIHLIGSLACQSQLWTSLLQKAQISEENILGKLSSVLVEDDEAFPRRRAMECLTMWITNRHPMTARIFPSNKAVDDQSQTERFPTSDEVQDLGVGSQSEATKTPSGFEIARSVCHACRDFDWEVKLRGLEFWEAVIDNFTGFKRNKLSAGTSKVKSGTLSGEELASDAKNDKAFQAGGIALCFEVLFDMGALDVLSKALNDCDHMVCEKALKILASLQHVAYPENSTQEQCVKTSRDFQETLGKGFGLEKFKEVLQGADLPALVQSCVAADNALRTDPVSLIEDILLAAEQHDENLLDCY
ncbi:integrator complex assembly factor BRAT1-like [Oculina patagonica]